MIDRKMNQIHRHLVPQSYILRSFSMGGEALSEVSWNPSSEGGDTIEARLFIRTYVDDSELVVSFAPTLYSDFRLEGIQHGTGRRIENATDTVKNKRHP